MSTIAVESVSFKPIQSLAPNSPVYVERVVATPQVVASPVATQKVVLVQSADGDCDSVRVRKNSGYSCGWGAVLLVFLFVTILAFFLLYALNPTSVQNVDAAGNPNGTVSVGKCIVGALIFGVIFAIIFWAFAASQRF